MTPYASYQLRLWRKHLLQHQILIDLSLPELGLFGGESAAEEALLSTLLRALGVPLRLRAETQRRYGREQSRANARREELASKSQAPGSFYVAVSRMFALFEASVEAAGVREDGDFESARERLLYQTMLDLGVFYGIFGHTAMREAAQFYQKGRGEYDRSAPPEPPEGPLFRTGDPLHIELHLETFAHAQRVLREVSDPRWLSSLSALASAPATARMQIHRFALIATHVLGLPTHISSALGFLQGTRLVDEIVAERLSALVEGREARETQDAPADVLAIASETVRRLKLAADAIEEAWRDGVLDPEETLILRYALLHLFGLSEDTAARFIGSREGAERLVAALRAGNGQ